MSRELDAEVAEKVMGWNKCDKFTNPLLRKVQLVIIGYPHYSTDIAAAWLVVEKIPGWFALIKEEEGWKCEYEIETGEIDYVLWPTAPEAICRAALAALKAG